MPAVDLVGLLVFSPDRSIESVNQSLNEFDSSDFLENQFDNELAELSELNQYACEKFAKKHGPLFGTMYFENGICKEPLDMWRRHQLW